MNLSRNRYRVVGGLQSSVDMLSTLEDARLEEVHLPNYHFTHIYVFLLILLRT
jgi:hypothetical protein